MKQVEILYKLIGFSLFVSYFTVYPLFLKQNWNTIRSALFGFQYEDKIFYAIVVAWSFVSIFLAGVIIFYFIYSQKIPFLEQFRIQKKDWPWDDKSKKSQKAWKKLMFKSIGSNLLNLFVVALALLIFEIVQYPLEVKFSLEEIPQLHYIFLEVMACWHVHEICFYIIHRTLHHRWVYAKIHKVHHQYNQNITIAALYFHPLEFLFGILFPGLMGRRLFGGIHLISLSLWVGILSYSAVEAHCGYHFPWTPMGWSETIFVTAEYHDFHHSHNVGTYSAIFSYWDTIFGTNKDFKLFKQKKEKLNLQEGKARTD